MSKIISSIRHYTSVVIILGISQCCDLDYNINCIYKVLENVLKLRSFFSKLSFKNMCISMYLYDNK